MDNTKCSICKAPTSFERHNESEPREGEICSICESWVCPNCVAWDKCLVKPHNYDVVCKNCNN